MSTPPAGDSPAFQVRTVRLDEAAGLLQETIAPLASAGGRILAWFALLSLPILLMQDGHLETLFLRESYTALAYTGFTALLDAARRRELPHWRHFAAVFRLGESRLVLIVLSGVVPLAIGLLTLCAVWGADATATYLSGPFGPQERQMGFDSFIAEMIANLPFTFVAPVCALFPWSGSRSMSANLLACVANWRWVLLSTAVFALAAQALELLVGGGSALQAVALIGSFALEFVGLAWTLSLARRIFPPG